MSDTRPATDEELPVMREDALPYRTERNKNIGVADLCIHVNRLLARLAAAEAERDAASQAAIDWEQRWEGVVDERDAARAENARLREALLDVAECSWCATRFTPDSGWPCEKCKDARCLLEAKP